MVQLCEAQLLTVASLLPGLLGDAEWPVVPEASLLNFFDKALSLRVRTVAVKPGAV